MSLYNETEDRFSAPDRAERSSSASSPSEIEERGGGIGKSAAGFLPSETRAADVPESQIAPLSGETVIHLGEAEADDDDMLEALPDEDEVALGEPISTEGGGVGEIIDDEDDEIDGDQSAA